MPGLYARKSDGTAGRALDTSKVYHNSTLKTIRRVYFVYWTFPEGEPAVQHIVLLEDWAAPDVAPNNVGAVSDSTVSGHAEWQTVNDSGDVRFPYSVVVQWYDNADGSPLPGAEDFASQSAGATSSRDFSGFSGVVEVYAGVRYSNSYGVGPEAFTNVIQVSGA